MPNKKVAALLFIIVGWCSPHFSGAFAQDAVHVQYTDSPSDYVQNLLSEIAKEGAPRLRKFLTDVGYSTPQAESVLAVFQSGVHTDQKPTIKLIKDVDSSGVLRQVYAYSHFGGNAWFFWRLDFVKTSNGWALSNFAFNSEYRAVMVPSFNAGDEAPN